MQHIIIKGHSVKWNDAIIIFISLLFFFRRRILCFFFVEENDRKIMEKSVIDQ